MKTFLSLTKRNIKLFFKDKGMFFVSMITPVILLVLYATFLANVYRDSFTAALPQGFTLDKKIIDGTVAGQLISSLLAVIPITVAFNSNMRMVSDKMNGVSKDILVSPVNKGILALSYFVGTLVTTLLVCYGAVAIGFVYIAIVGWYMSFADVVLVLVDVLLLCLFGTALSSLINVFLSTQGQMSAVGTIVSAGYGFVCGAYMPISQFSKGLQNVMSFLPGTYGTVLVRNHCLNGVFREMSAQSIPDEALQGLRNGVDCNLYFFDHKVEIWVAYLVVLLCIAVLVGVYVLLSVLRKKRK